MDWLLVLISVFAIFIPALLLPGPDFVAVVRSAMTRGTAGGLMTATGVSVGLGFYASLSLLGLSAILVEYQWLSWAIRIAGGSYLIYLGIKLLFSKAKNPATEAVLPAQKGNGLLFGFLVTLTNPKAIVLFTSVFATVVTEATPLWLMFLMIAIVIGSAWSWYALVSIFMSSKTVMQRFQHSVHWIERAAGVCFITIGGRILADSRTPVSQ
ncbi:MAG: LysE family translocator [Sneathiella sp.]